MKMAYNIDWIIPKLRSPSKLWKFVSTITIVCVGLFSKIVIQWLNESKVYNRRFINCAIEKRPKNVPLITVSNHHSCFDDPGIWGTLKMSHLVKRSVIRWTLSAHDICFTCTRWAYFFSLGKCIPVIRGSGIYQQAIDFCIELLTKGEWLHVFPEGKVNSTKEDLRFKWGVGRIIWESPVTPIVLPIWHIGMDEVLPNTAPHGLCFNKKVTFNYGKPIDLTAILGRLRAKKVTAEEARKEITDSIQSELLKLKKETEILHQKRTSCRWRTVVGKILHAL